MSVYVYAITDERSTPDLADTAGVGAPPAPLRVVRCGGVAAVVSDAAETVRAKRRDLKAHQDVLQKLRRTGPVLPMRFGLLAEDDAAVRRVLTERERDFSERLRALDGRVEFNVRAVQDEDTALQAVLAGSEQVRRLNEAARSGSHQDRLALGEAVAAELQSRQQAMAARVSAALRPLAEAEASGTLSSSGDIFLSVSFLVRGERAAEFGAAVDRLAEDIGPEAELRLYGPLPPYSFVEAAAGAPERQWAS
ncbi:GvpL/GvpF family gas vesicle protein [Peterkaempfera griseoplana]|uniref:GvpL/GvpF family gas vesicle protein n=1 Tax=Peterkaempfera griseoplana TaxID=66896 RepID=UPI0006E191C4|nr:GvpL/GvpF family gas vesicle protein [Peterkaempfera griseoplana]